MMKEVPWCDEGLSRWFFFLLADSFSVCLLFQKTFVLLFQRPHVNLESATGKRI